MLKVEVFQMVTMSLLFKQMLQLIRVILAALYLILGGKVVGVNAQIFTRSGGFMGLSFAIPIHVAEDVINQLKKNGKVVRGWLGVYIQEVTDNLAKSFGMKKPMGALISKIILGWTSRKI